jgi:predicted ATPase
MHLKIIFVLILLNHLTHIFAVNKKDVMTKENFIVISGCSGGGKSTLISELKSLGFFVVKEPGREIVKVQTKKEGSALPWKDLDKFLEKALEKNISNYKSIVTNKLVFFDRSIVDTIISFDSDSAFVKAAKKYRYNKNVFLAPPWKEIYKTDKERKHSFSEAKSEYKRLVKNYKELGYEIITLPKVSVKKRIEFILNFYKYNL